MTLRWILALSACLMTPLAQAGGPTDEDEAHADWAHLHPLRAESADGQWQVSVNAKGELLRQRRGAGSPPQALRVGLNVHALATHGDASQVLLRLHNGCLLQADFRRSPATLKVHLASKLTAGPSPDSACTARPALGKVCINPGQLIYRSLSRAQTMRTHEANELGPGAIEQAHAPTRVPGGDGARRPVVGARRTADALHA